MALSSNSHIQITPARSWTAPGPANTNKTPGGATAAPHPHPTTIQTENGIPSTGATRQEVATNDNTAQEKEEVDRIGNMVWVGMLAVAIPLDIIAILCVIFVVSAWVGWIIEIVGILIFGLWFLIVGLPLISPKSLANWAGNLVLGETITAGAWPGFTIGIILTIIVTKTKEKTGVDALQVISSVEGGLKKPSLKTAIPGSSVPAGGATPHPTPSGAKNNVPGLSGARSADKNPLIASQQAHFADPSQPVARGATQPQKKFLQMVPREPEKRPQNDNSYIDNSNIQIQEPANDSVRETFPGTSPQFGQGIRQEKQGKILQFKQKPPISSGATPVPEEEGEDIS